MFWTLLLAAFKLFLEVAVILYAGLVLIALKSNQPPQLSFDWNDPARSGERILIWTGVMAFGFVWRELKAVLDILEDTSADVGEWLLHRRGTRS